MAMHKNPIGIEAYTIPMGILVAGDIAFHATLDISTPNQAISKQNTVEITWSTTVIR